MIKRISSGNIVFCLLVFTLLMSLGGCSVNDHTLEPDKPAVDSIEDFTTIKNNMDESIDGLYNNENTENTEKSDGDIQMSPEDNMQNEDMLDASSTMHGEPTEDIEHLPPTEPSSVVDSVVADSHENEPSSSSYVVEGLRIPDLGTAKQLTAALSNVPGTVGIVTPMNYDLQLAVEKGLCGNDGFGEKYLYMQALYRKGFESWLLKTTSLRDFDDRLSNSELNFAPMPRSQQSFYQRYSTWGLQFIYLCNNIPIERLSKNDLQLLYSQVENGSADINQELENMIKRTFSDVLMAYPHLGESALCGYGFNGNFSPNRSIALEISNNDYDEEGNYRDFSTNIDRIDLMESLANEMQNVLSEQLGHRVVVHVYE